MELETIKLYFRAWGVYFNLRFRVKYWEGDPSNPFHEEMVKMSKELGIKAYDMCKERYGKLLPKNPMK